MTDEELDGLIEWLSKSPWEREPYSRGSYLERDHAALLALKELREHRRGRKGFGTRGGT